MIPDWARSLLFKIAIGAVVLFALLSCMQTISASEMPKIHVTTPPLVSFSFGPSTQDTATSSFRISNMATERNATLSVNSISFASPPYITITTSDPKAFDLAGGEHQDIDLTIKVNERNPNNEGEHPCTITVNSNAEPKSVELKVAIKYNVKIEVTPSSPINFGSVRHGTTTNLENQITIGEVYGYKPVNVALKISGENNWVSSSPSDTISISADEPQKIDFTLVAPDEPDHNQYSWTFSISAG
ncbi:MAG: hypothetical protein KAT65_27045, partial [Methanophagales archaeon]|nr:hypothetical protein [Methanophagales archaeon]